MTFENKVSSHGIYYSQYIASWVKSGGNFKDKVIRDESGHIEDIVWTGEFRDWLRSIGISDNEAREIAMFADNGKLGLEESAKAYLNSKGSES